MITYSGLYMKFTRSFSVPYYAVFGLNTKIYWQQHLIICIHVVYNTSNIDNKVTSTDVGLESLLAK